MPAATALAAEGFTSNVLGRLDELGEQALVEIADLEARRQVLDVTIKRLREFVKSTGVELPPKAKSSTAPTRRSRAGQNGKVAPDRVRQIGEAVMALGPDRKFTILELHREIMNEPWSEPATYTAFKFLRSIEFVAALDTDANGRTYYKLLDPSALDQVRSQANGSSAQH